VSRRVTLPSSSGSKVILVGQLDAVVEGSMILQSTHGDCCPNITAPLPSRLNRQQHCCVTIIFRNVLTIFFVAGMWIVCNDTTADDLGKTQDGGYASFAPSV